METTTQELLTLDKLNTILSEIDAEYQGTKFEIFTGGSEEEGGLWVQVGTYRPDTYTSKMALGKGGKAFVSKYAVHDEIVKKVFGLCLAYVEHETREGFKWRGKRVFGPHITIEALASVANKTNYRNKQNG